MTIEKWCARIIEQQLPFSELARVLVFSTRRFGKYIASLPEPEAALYLHDMLKRAVDDGVRGDVEALLVEAAKSTPERIRSEWRVQLKRLENEGHVIPRAALSGRNGTYSMYKVATTATYTVQEYWLDVSRRPKTHSVLMKWLAHQRWEVVFLFTVLTGDTGHIIYLERSQKDESSNWTQNVCKLRLLPRHVA